MLLTALSFVLVAGFSLPKNLTKKVLREIEKTFEVESFELEAVAVPDAINSELPARITGDNLFRIRSGERLLGYAFVDQAPSKTAKFDYLVLFNEQAEIIQSRVLIYREEYGGEIGSNRWLKQFNGLSGRDRVSTETNVDGISGATISVRSMTHAMDDLLQSIGILQEKQVL